MPIEQSRDPQDPERLVSAAQGLLQASNLCAIATVTPDGRPYINTAYFAYGEHFRLVWLSHPEAAHSRNIKTLGSAAVATYDSNQTWGKPDRGIQLFGAARELAVGDADEAEAAYARRFVDYRRRDFDAYRFYVLDPHHLKLFDEHEFGAGHFVLASVDDDRGLVWEMTEVYRSDAG